MPLTATPLQTSTKVSRFSNLFLSFTADAAIQDLAALGRLTGIPYFFTFEAWNEEKEDSRELRAARQALSDSQDPLDDHSLEQDFLKLKQIEIARRMQEKYEGHVIRRTRDSLDWQGTPLIPLPPLRTEYVYLDLTERELQIITDHGKSLREK